MEVVPHLRLAHVRLEADDALAILAQLAVHVARARLRLVHPAHEGVDDLGVVVQIAGQGQVQIRMAIGEGARLGMDLLHQAAGEKEIGKHDEAPETEAAGALQGLVQERAGDTDETGLGPAEAHPLPQHAGDLGDVAVGVRVGGTAPYHQQEGVLAAPRGQRALRRLDARRGQAQQARVHPQLGAVGDGKAGVSGGQGVEFEGDVVLGVARGHEHAGDGGDAPRPPGHQGRHPFFDGGAGEFQEADLAQTVGEAGAQVVGQAQELVHPFGVAGAVADDEQGGCWGFHGRSGSRDRAL